MNRNKVRKAERKMRKICHLIFLRCDQIASPLAACLHITSQNPVKKKLMTATGTSANSKSGWSFQNYIITWWRLQNVDKWTDIMDNAEWAKNIHCLPLLCTPSFCPQRQVKCREKIRASAHAVATPNELQTEQKKHHDEAAVVIGFVFCRLWKFITTANEREKKHNPI